MNINHYRGAMDRIVPDAELKERIMKQTEQNHARVPARRVLAGALAAVLTAACLATAAFAASPELRTAVLSFFRMEEHEQVPSSSVSPEGPISAMRRLASWSRPSISKWTSTMACPEACSMI